jgi:hypothetical protein
MAVVTENEVQRLQFTLSSKSSCEISVKFGNS